MNGSQPDRAGFDESTALDQVHGICSRFAARV